MLLALLFLQSPDVAFAIDSVSSRKNIITPRSKKLYRSNRTRNYLSLGGNYASDYNSKSYQLNSRYLYQGPDWINELNFENEGRYSDKGSGSKRVYDVKTSELYDISASSKLRIGNSNNYGAAFHKTLYDHLSKYYYDNHTALGIGRMFFDDKIELDLSLGYHDVKSYGNELNFITSIRTKLRITKNLTMVQRGYLFIDHESMDNELKSSLVYRLKSKLSLELRHSFSQRRYEDDLNNRVINQVNRSVTFGLIFDLN